MGEAAVDFKPPTTTAVPDAALSIFTREEMEAKVSTQFKEFCKLKCAQCGQPATKRFSKSMSFVVKNMIETFWCKECGRLLCEKHRDNHTCEKFDAEKERLRKMSVEDVKRQMIEAEERKTAAEAAAKDEERAKAEEANRKVVEMQNRRKQLAGKAQQVERFLQGVSRDVEFAQRRGKKAHDEILELYTKVSRIALFLYNEIEAPSVKGRTADEEWNELKEAYERARELTGMIIMHDGAPLNMRNHWDPPDPPQQGDPAFTNFGAPAH